MTEEALIKLRRKRKAKRLAKSEPLFAYELLKADFPDYTLEQFQNDITRRKSRSKRKKKNPLVKYGRYETMKRLLREYEETGDVAKAIQAQKLRDRMTQPYEINAWFENGKEVFYCSAIMSYKTIQTITEMSNKIASLEEFIKQVHEFLRYLPGNFYHAKKEDKNE